MGVKSKDVFFNPISQKSSKPHHLYIHEDMSTKSKGAKLESVPEHETSPFTAFLFSLLSSCQTGRDDPEADDKHVHCTMSSAKENIRRISLCFRGKQSLVRAISLSARRVGYRSQQRKGGSSKLADETRNAHSVKDPEPAVKMQDASDEHSLLLDEKARNVLDSSLPALVQGRKWILLYSTWRHGVSLATLYRRSALWPGLSLLVVGDTQGAVFGGLVEAPLVPTNNRRYQGTNNTFVFTNSHGNPVIYRSTGANRYFTLCNTDSLAIGGGSRFALYLDGDLMNGSSAVSETYGNPCLAHSEDFEVKQVELWGFVYASKYEEVLALGQAQSLGISRW